MTFIINQILLTVQQTNNRMIATAVAPSSIAASVLTQGRTADLVFKLVINTVSTVIGAGP